MTNDPRPVQMLLDGYGVDDVRVRTGLRWSQIATMIRKSPHRYALRPYYRLVMSRAVKSGKVAA